MVDTVVVSLLSTKMIYYLDGNDISVKKDDIVVFSTDGGLQIGKVITARCCEKKENLDLPLKKIERIATKDDISVFEKNCSDATESLKYAKNISKDLDLKMNFIEAFYNFERSQLLFSYVAEDRVDFRELAKKLAQKYKTRIELRQVGVRDKAKKIGGLGPCGLFLCCNSFLTDFNSVSINMAKNQFLALNPSKINGVCGRLLCCLSYENDVYTNLKKGLPKMGAIVETEYGIGKVVAIDVFKGKYSVDLKEKGIIEIYKDNNGSVK